MTSIPLLERILRGFKLIFALWMTGALLISCASTTSKNEFMEMSLPERQATVCYESDSFVTRKTQLDSYQAQILEKQEALNQGYRVHRYCQSVTVPLPLRDCSDKEGFAKGWCEGQPKSKKETRCTENPVSIDPEYEEASRDKYQAAYTKLNSQHLVQTQSCLTKVAQISSEEAYVYYSQRIEPQAAGTLSRSTREASAASSSTQASTSSPTSPSSGHTDYTGQTKAGLRHGIGTQEYPNGDKYFGNWRNDVREGEGTYFYSEGAVWQGNWEKDMANGYMTQTFPDGSVYEGFMKDDKLDGVGVLTCADGTTHDFYFEDDKPISGDYRACSR